jgi:hemin uptake protein HemP
MAEKVDLQKSYSKLNESIVKLFDESGVRRSLNVPYVDGENMDAHIAAVGTAAGDAGGIPSNLLISRHHSDGKGWGSGDGATTGFPADRLRTTLIPKDDENAKASISAAQKHINNMASLLGKDNPVIQTSQGQLNLVKKTDAQGMNLLDLGTLLTQIMYRPTQLLAKTHAATKSGGAAPQGQAPGDLQQQEQPGGGEAQPAQGTEQPAAGGEEQADNTAPQAATPEAQEQAPAAAQA